MKTKQTILFSFMVSFIANISCNRPSSDHANATASEPVHEHAKDHENTDDSHEHADRAGESSDLDHRVEELVAKSCEHGIKAFECDACRYEVGFVRAPTSLAKEELITTAEVENRKVAVPIVLTGEVRFDDRRVGHVNSQVEGVIKRVHVVLGDKVRKGQALIEIESVAVGEAQAASLEAQGLLAVARRNFERISELRDEKIASEREFLQAKQELQTAEIRSEGAQGKLARLGSIRADTHALKRGTSRGRVVLRSPIDGSVLVMHAVPGEVAKTEETLVTVGDNTTVWVWADLYERDISAVSRGQAEQELPASISVKAYRDEVFAGTVDLISPAMDESSRTVKVRVEVNNTNGRLLAGMFASVEIFLPGTESTLAVPESAVLEDEGRSFVFVHHQGEYYLRRPVVIGRSWSGWVEINQGLRLGQIVVAEGAFLMKSDVLRSKMGAGCAD